MMNGQFKHSVNEATQEVYDVGWRKASLAAVMLYGFGHMAKLQGSRTIRLDGKMALSIFTALGAGIAAVLVKLTGV